MEPPAPPFPAYRGPEPYAFVSYARRDAPAVYSLLSQLHNDGYRIWYDEGIESGGDFTDEIAAAIDGCAAFLVFVSPVAVSRRMVKDETRHAYIHDKPILPIYVEETTPPPGFELITGTPQAVMAYQLTATEARTKIEGFLADHGLAATAAVASPDPPPDSGPQPPPPTGSTVAVPTPPSLSVFISYHRADDKAYGGIVARLKDQLERRFKAETGANLEVFVDRGLPGGVKWHDKMQTQVATAGFFVPLVTMAYFDSRYCLEELNWFLDKAADSAQRRLTVLPVVLAGMKRIHRGHEQAEIRAVAELNCRDATAAIRKGLRGPKWEALLAELLADLITAWEAAPLSVGGSQRANSGEADSLLDAVSRAEARDRSRQDEVEDEADDQESDCHGEGGEPAAVLAQDSVDPVVRVEGPDDVGAIPEARSGRDGVEQRLGMAAVVRADLDGRPLVVEGQGAPDAVRGLDQAKDEALDGANDCATAGNAAQPGDVDALRDPDPWRTFDVVLVTVGDKKVQVIKKVRGLTGLSLTEAKNCVEAAPSVVLERVASAQATKAREELESVGATVSLPVADVDVDVPRNKGPGGAFDVVLETVGDKKIQVSKKVRELTGLGLRETVDLVNGAPQIVLRRVNQDRATKARDQLEALGATVSLQQPGTRPTRGPEQGQG